MSFKALHSQSPAWSLVIPVMLRYSPLSYFLAGNRKMEAKYLHCVYKEYKHSTQASALFKCGKLLSRSSLSRRCHLIRYCTKLLITIHESQNSGRSAVHRYIHIDSVTPNEIMAYSQSSTYLLKSRACSQSYFLEDRQIQWLDAHVSASSRANNAKQKQQSTVTGILAGVLCAQKVGGSTKQTRSNRQRHKLTQLQVTGKCQCGHLPFV